LISAVEVDTSKSRVRLVQLRNTWGKTEWEGDWSNRSHLRTSELKKRLQAQERDDGRFYMAFGDFLQYFSDVQVCKVHEDHVYSQLRATSSHKNATFFRMSVHKEGNYYITINQIARRHHQNDSNFQHSGVSLVVGKVENGVVKHVEGVFKADLEVWTDDMLKPGDYVVHVKVQWYDKKSHDFVLSGYGPEEVKFVKVENTQDSNVLSIASSKEKSQVQTRPTTASKRKVEVITSGLDVPHHQILQKIKFLSNFYFVTYTTCHVIDSS